RLALAMRGWLRHRGAGLETLGHRLPHPRQQYRLAAQALEAQRARLAPVGQRLLVSRRQALDSLVPRPPSRELRHAGDALQACGERLRPAMTRLLMAKSVGLDSCASLLLSLSYKE